MTIVPVKHELTKLINVSNHMLTEEQSNGYEVVNMPENLKKEWANITPENIKDVISDIHTWIREQGEHYECVVHLAGQMSAVHVLLTMLQASDYTCLYSYTERVSVDQQQADGSVKKLMIFKHKAWVEYINPMNYMEVVTED